MADDGGEFRAAGGRGRRPHDRRPNQAGTRADDWDEPTPVGEPERLTVNLSVRFTAAEIATVRARAAEAGLKPTTYIRQCALMADQPPVDRARLAAVWTHSPETPRTFGTQPADVGETRLMQVLVAELPHRPRSR